MGGLDTGTLQGDAWCRMRENQIFDAQAYSSEVLLDAWESVVVNLLRGG